MTGTGAAAAMIVLGVSILALVDNLIRFVAADLGLWQFHVIRAVLIGAVLLGVARLRGWPMRPRRPGHFVMRSAMSSLGMVCYFGALSQLTLSQAAAGLFTAPIFVLVLGVVLFGDRIGPVRAVAVAIGFAGVLVTLRPWSEAIAPLAATLAVAAGLFYGLGALFTRRWCADEGTAALTLGYFLGMGAWGVIGFAAVVMASPEVPAGAAGFFWRGWAPVDARLAGWVVLHSSGSIVAMALIVRAYQIADAAQVSLFEYVFLPIAALWTWVLFAEVPVVTTVTGTGLIALAGIVIVLRTNQRVPETEPQPQGVVPDIPNR